MAITAASLQAFEAEAGAETNRYCGPFPYSGCGESPSCVTAYNLGKVTCLQGRCVALQNDAGP